MNPQEMKNFDLLVQKALVGDVFDVQIQFQSQPAHLCSYGHRIDIPTQFQHLGEPLRVLLMRNLLWRKLQGYVNPIIESGFTRGEFAYAVSGPSVPLKPLQMKFFTPPQGSLFQEQLALWRWHGALYQALQGKDISYDCAALNEAGRLLQSSFSERVSLEQLGSTFYSEPFSKTNITAQDVEQAVKSSSFMNESIKVSASAKPTSVQLTSDVSTSNIATSNRAASNLVTVPTSDEQKGNEPKDEKSKHVSHHLLYQLSSTINPISTKDPKVTTKGNTLYPIS